MVGHTFESNPAVRKPLTRAKRNGYRWFDFSWSGRVPLDLRESTGEYALGTLPGPDRYKLRFGAVPVDHARQVVGPHGAWSRRRTSPAEIDQMSA